MSSRIDVGVRVPYLRGVVWWEYEVLVYVGVGNLGIGLSHGVDSVESFRGVWESPLDRMPGCGGPPGPVFVPKVRDPAELSRLLSCGRVREMRRRLLNGVAQFDAGSQVRFARLPFTIPVLTIICNVELLVV